MKKQESIVVYINWKGNNKLGICVIKKSKQNEWKESLNMLENTIKYWINPENTIDKTVETIQLFYDR